MLTITPAPTEAIDAAIKALKFIGSQARAEIEDLGIASGSTREGIDQAFAAAERIGIPEDVADDAYRRGFDWGEI